MFFKVTALTLHFKLTRSEKRGLNAIVIMQ